MDPATILEARRLLHDLVFIGRATTKGERVLDPKDEVMVTMLEKIASKKIEEPDVPISVEGYTPKATYKEVRREMSPNQGDEAPQAASAPSQD